MPNALAEEAIREARNLDYDGVSVRVIAPEHPVALALQEGGARRRERAWQAFEGKARWHQEQVALPLKENVRILLQLQQLDLPLLVRQRPLQEWERPWAVEP